jgi:hypothetical protein
MLAVDSVVGLAINRVNGLGIYRIIAGFAATTVCVQSLSETDGSLLVRCTRTKKQLEVDRTYMADTTDRVNSYD